MSSLPKEQEKQNSNKSVVRISTFRYIQHAKILTCESTGRSTRGSYGRDCLLAILTTKTGLNLTAVAPRFLNLSSSLYITVCLLAFHRPSVYFIILYYALINTLSTDLCVVCTCSCASLGSFKDVYCLYICLYRNEK